ARLVFDLLPVQEVARIVVRDADAERTGCCGKSGVAEELARVLHTRREASCALRPRGVVLQEPAVLLQCGAAARGVHDERIHVESIERRDVASGEDARVRTLTSVR